MLQIYCKNNQSYIKVENGSSLLEILRDLNLQMPYPVVSAKVNNKAEGLTFRVYTNKDVEFLDLTGYAHICPFRMLRALQGCQ